MNKKGSDIRSLLERQIIRARDLSESGAERAMNRLSVNDNEPRTALSPDERRFRVRLRDRMRQLDGFADLVTECAYEKWHRMLFARFLAENQLLIHPKHQVAVTLEECKELAEEERSKSGWELAAKFANKMLPQIFRKNDPVLDVEFLPEDSQELEKLLAEIKPEVFHADDGLGWEYQYWQSKKKDEVNASEVKIGAKELPAVTQLFTEPYMVSFLLDNSLGAWWAARRLTEDDLQNAESEEELRKKASIPGVPLEYLRFVKEENGKWRPAAGTFDAWPEDFSEFKVLDPCCGSGHFLVAALQMLIPIRMEREGLNAKEAIDAVLSQNLHGLDIDKRVTEITAFALAFTAWRYPGAGGFRQLPMLNIACSGLPVKATKETWQKFANGDHNLRIALGTLHEEFKNAPTLGSLLDPAKSPAANIVKWDEMISALTSALEMERTDLDLEAGVIAQELAKAAEIISQKYTLVVTNVPFLGKSDQNRILRDYIESSFPHSIGNLATSFIERCGDFTELGGTISIVTIQDWLFLNVYKQLRRKLLTTKQWNILVKMGAKAFSTPMWDFNTMLFNATNSLMNKDNSIECIDISTATSNQYKEKEIKQNKTISISQEIQLTHKGSTIITEKQDTSEFLAFQADSYTGIQTGDDPRYRFLFWEISSVNNDWVFDQATVSDTIYYGGKTGILSWKENGQELRNTPGAYIRGLDAWNKIGISVSQMQKLPVCIYTGEAWNMNCATIIPKKNEDITALWVFCSSDNFNREVRKINQSLKVNPGYFLKISFNSMFNDNYFSHSTTIIIPFLLHASYFPFFRSNGMQP